MPSATSWVKNINNIDKYIDFFWAGGGSINSSLFTLLQFSNKNEVSDFYTNTVAATDDLPT